MAKKNKKNTRNLPPAPADKSPSKGAKGKSAPASHQATRETVESLVIALVLAFLFRTFQAEAFVIPTGSMAQTLMGQHKDVYCDQCGQRFKINASNESPDNYPTYAIQQEFRRMADRVPDSKTRRYLNGIADSPGSVLRQQVQTVSGICQACRYPQPTRPDLPANVLPPGDAPAYEPTHSGDRILVNKYLYSFVDPARWDVVVFKYPGNSTKNYIKRLVGISGEELRISGGDVYVRPAGSDEPYRIARKPPHKMLAMRQLVHDTHRDPATLRRAGWPLSWSKADPDSPWKIEETVSGTRVDQQYRIESSDQAAWLHYRHTPASYEAWQVALAARDSQPLIDAATPQLVTDFNSYNTEVDRRSLTLGQPPVDLSPRPHQQGLHWVGDLMLEADVKVTADSGEVLIEIVEAGRKHRCVIDVATGAARFEVLPFESETPMPGFAPTAKTSVTGRGSYKLRFANFDDQLTLWVNGSVVAFEESTECPSMPRLAPPRTSSSDPGDRAPLRIGARGASINVDDLRVYRDIYYIAATADRQDFAPGYGGVVLDIRQDGRLMVDGPNGERAHVWDIPSNPSLWPLLRDRHEVDFATTETQLFVMGDNSASSLDCRLWDQPGNDGGRPGGPYLERSLLIGKAACVYWPHALVSIPTPKQGLRIPIIPNLGDIRLVR